MGTGVAMAAEIDHKGIAEGVDVDLVGAEQKQHLELACRRRRDHAKRVEAARSRHEAKVETADPRRRGVEDRKAVPAFLPSPRRRHPRRQAQHFRSVRSRQRALPDQNDRPLGRGQSLAEFPRTIGEPGQRIGTRAEVLVGIGEVHPLADETDWEAALTPALADARVQHRRLVTRIGADDQQRVGRLDPRDGGVEDVARATERRIELAALLPAIEIADAHRRHQLAQREDFLDAGEVTGNGADPLRLGRLGPLGDRRECLAPGRPCQPAIAPHVRPVEPLASEAIPYEAALVGNPLLVHRIIEPRQDAHHLAVARVDADGRADRVHHVDRFRLGELPRPRLECVRLRGERTDRTQVDDVALQLRAHRMFEVRGDLHVLTASGGAELRHTGNLGREADAARALDAPRHDRLDQRPDVFVLDRPLVLVEPAAVDAVGHRLVLQVALAALVADRAVERVVDEQELHHPLAGAPHHLRAGDDLRRLAVRAGPAVAHRPGARGDRLRRALQFDQAHATVAGDRQALVETEARYLRTRRLARLQQRELRRDVDLGAVDLDLAHAACSSTLAPRRLFQSSARARLSQPKA